MKYLRNGLYLGVLLLTLLATGCTLGLPKPSIYAGPSQPSVANNVVPTGVPPIGLGPINIAPTPACIPPTSSVDNIGYSCANQAAGSGGVTFVGPAGYNSASSTDNVSCNWLHIPNVSCSGPQDTKFQVTYCMSCGEPYAQTLGAFVCSSGYMNNGQGDCVPPVEVGTLGNAPCLTGSHWDNTLQNCVDNTTQKLASPCPAAFPYYNPDFHYCLAKAYPEVFNCQTYNLQTGECLSVVKKPSTGSKCPAGQTYTCNPMLGGACSCK